ncbi:hypothetical protein Pan153_32200 [Gimesia panareensis]|uniref:Response regulatory domain-containing protein n=1 Tax=Gimesia panareensis TaxID=2527978 RepID=A0A518FQD1_9PLAN|nr:response regulator [Gimesia panareensis]QDV18561.1 hypothetical protein Pan153_32200 [Gimesia panareensis]
MQFTIVIADDDALYRTDTLCRRFNEHTNWTVLDAKDASECLKIIRQNALQIDFALIDVRMPQGENEEISARHDNTHGIAVAAIIRDEFPHIHIFGMSVDADDESKLWFDINTRGFLEKQEFQPTQFAKTLKKLEMAQNHSKQGEIKGIFHSPHTESIPDHVKEILKEPVGRKKNINALMLETLQKKPEAMGWTIKKWTHHLNCAGSTVHATETWQKILSPHHKLLKAEYAIKKRHNGRPDQ